MMLVFAAIRSATIHFSEKVGDPFEPPFAHWDGRLLLQTHA
jgi:hypothetical protein